MTCSRAERLLRELLAVVHRDGGHVAARLRLDEATAAAIEIVSRLLAERDEARAARWDEARLADESELLKAEAYWFRTALETIIRSRGTGMTTDMVELVNAVAANSAEIQRLHAEIRGLKAERDEARYRIQRLKAKVADLRERLQVDPGGSDKIDELEQAMQFVRHELEVMQDERDEARSEVEQLKQELSYSHAFHITTGPITIK